MHGYVANTDADWHAYLRGTSPHDEVNFWRPAGGRSLRVIQPGEPVFFRLKPPHACIAGFGRLVRYEKLPVQLAWDCFGEKNGAPDFPAMMERVRHYNRKLGNAVPGPMHEIGCIMVGSPVFFAPSEGVLQPADWQGPIVSGKGYDLEHGEGRRIWEACLSRIQAVDLAGSDRAADAPRFGNPYLVSPRLGQGSFRAVVTEAYGRACAITREHSLPVLDAAHIRPFAQGGAHSVRNGLVLRSDIHRLFDAGYVTITPEYRFEVSARLKQDFSNGRSYLALHGETIQVPERPQDRPEPTLLRWHNEFCYNG